MIEQARPVWPKMKQYILENGIRAEESDERARQSLQECSGADAADLSTGERSDGTSRQGTHVAENDRSAGFVRHAIELTLAWNGEKHTIPGPPAVPLWFKQSTTSKKSNGARTYRRSTQPTTPAIGMRSLVEIARADGSLRTRSAG